MAFQYSAQTVTENNGSIVDNSCRSEKTKQKMKMRIKTSTNKKWQLFFFLERFIVWLAGLKETLVLGGFSGSEEYFLSFKMSQVYFMCCSVFP